MNEHKILVLYRTKHGSTKRYAGWIGDALNADVVDAKTSGWDKQLGNYDTIIFGGNLDVDGIYGLPKIRAKLTDAPDSPDKNIIFFAVGSFPPSEDTVKELLEANFPPRLRATTTLFHFRGRLDYLGLNFWDKFMMRGIQKRILEKKEDLRTPTENELLLAYDQEMNWSDKSTITPLVDFVKSSLTPEQVSEMEEKAAVRIMETAKREEEEAIAWAEELKRRELLHLQRLEKEKEYKLRGLSKKQRAYYDEKQAQKKAALEDKENEGLDIALPDDDFFDSEIPENEFEDDYSEFHDDKK